MLIRRIRCSMNSNAMLLGGVRVKEWQTSLKRHARVARRATKKSLTTLYVRSFSWIGSVEPCTGVLCETCQRCLRDVVILKVSQGTHHATASSMLAAVAIGCRVCTCLWRQLAADRSIDPENVPKEMNEHDRSIDFENVLKEMNEQRGDFSRFWSFSWSPIFVAFSDLVLSHQSWYSKPSAAPNEIVPRIDLLSYQDDRITLMNHYWKLANGWLSECLSHHTKCKHVHSVENYCPTRLIEVRVNSSDCELRLYLTSNGSIKEPYMTLSHCWGNSRFLRLTTSTRDRLQKGFNLAELPPTFQDAIMVTRNLGINFLWIDALCIIQDSNVDWQHEASLMSQVYSNSICNISALDAHDSTGGLFFNRDTSNIPYCTLKICRKFRRERLYEFAYTDFWSDSVQHAPLTRRAWVLQERLLSPRVLHFGKRQLLWECNELRACEVYPRGMRDPDIGWGRVSDRDKFLKESLTTILQGGWDNFLYFPEMHGAWNDLVQNYTKCNLTMSNDKLVAISGIVKRLQPSFKTKYLAGLWRHDLLEHLLWHVESYDEAKRPLVGEKRPEYRAPSWSWASIDAPIVPRPSLNVDVKYMAKIIKAHVTPVTEDITGQILNGHIRLRAPLFPVKVEKSTELGYLPLRWDWERLESTHDAVPDVWPQSAVEGLQFVPLLMTWFSLIAKTDPPEIYGLIIQPVKGKQGVYQRWGYLQYPRSRGSEKTWSSKRVYSPLGLRLINGFGLRLINGEWTCNPPEKYAERIITII